MNFIKLLNNFNSFIVIGFIITSCSISKKSLNVSFIKTQKQLTNNDTSFIIPLKTNDVFLLPKTLQKKIKTNYCLAVRKKQKIHKFDFTRHN
jgi:hypothetical protein